MPRPVTFSPNPMISLIFQRLLEATPDNPDVPDEELARVTGLEMKDFEKWRPLVDQARRKAYRHEDKLFIRPRGQKMLRLASPKEWVSTVQATSRKVHRTAMRGAKMALKVDRRALPDAERRMLDLGASCLAAISHATKPSVMKRIEAAVHEVDRPLAIGRVLEIVR